MKKVILSIVIGLLAIDLMVVIPRTRYSVFAFGARFLLLGPSECSLAELRDEFEHRGNLPKLAPIFTFERTEAGLDLWNTSLGPIWTVHGDQILPFLTAEQLHDIYEPKGHEVRKGDIVLDCGANIGMFTRTALSRGASLVVAIEPAPRTLDAFRRNFQAEIRDGRVVVHPKGVWDYDAEMELSLDEANPGNNTFLGTDDAPALKVRVPLTTIDRIVAELNLPRVDFVKMDIEGSEKQALKGAENTIRRFRPRMSISTEHLADDYTAIPTLVQSIEPNYTHKGCDCVVTAWGVKSLVAAFDSVH